jgi:sugar lactone lactonase YvrE
MLIQEVPMEPKVLLDGLAYVESPRWHDGRLWFAHWGTGEIVAVDLDGKSDVVGHGPAGLGWSIDWLPDGRLLVTGQELLRMEPDGSMVRHADLSGVASHGWNEIVHDRAIFAAMLGGPDRTTLFLLAAEWRGIEHVDEAVAARTGQVLITKAPAPGAGWP